MDEEKVDQSRAHHQTYLHDERISGNDSFVGTVHDADEAVGRGFGTDTDTRKITLQDVLDETGFTSGVLPHQHDHGHGIEIRIAQQWVEELVEQVVLLDRLRTRTHTYPHKSRINIFIKQHHHRLATTTEHSFLDCQNTHLDVALV